MPKELIDRLASLVDGATVAVELSDIDSRWRENWLKQARQALSEYRKEQK
jgi:hypothetical protein